MTPLILRTWGGFVAGPVTMDYDGTRTIEHGAVVEAAAEQVALSGTAPMLGGSFGWRPRSSLELSMTIGVTFDRFHARFATEQTTEDGQVSRLLHEDYRNRTVPFGPRVTAILNDDGAVRPVLGGQVELWIPSTLQEHGEVREGYPTFWPPLMVLPGAIAGVEVQVTEHVDLFAHGAGWVTVGGTGIGEVQRLGGGVLVGAQRRM